MCSLLSNGLQIESSGNGIGLLEKRFKFFNEFLLISSIRVQRTDAEFDRNQRKGNTEYDHHDNHYYDNDDNDNNEENLSICGGVSIRYVKVEDLEWREKKCSTSISAGCLCPICQEVYQDTRHRPIAEITCGHLICYQCFVLNTNQSGCIQCDKTVQVKDPKQTEEKAVSTEEPISSELKLSDRIHHVFHQVFGLSEVSPWTNGKDERSINWIILVSSKSIRSDYRCT